MLSHLLFFSMMYVLIDVLFRSASFCIFTIKASWVSAVNTTFFNRENFVVSWNRQLAGVRYACTLLFDSHRFLAHFDFRVSLQEIPRGCQNGTAVVTIVVANPGQSHLSLLDLLSTSCQLCIFACSRHFSYYSDYSCPIIA